MCGCDWSLTSSSMRFCRSSAMRVKGSGMGGVETCLMNSLLNWF